MNILIKDVNAILPEGVVKQTDIGVKDDKIAFIGDVPADFTADKIISNQFIKLIDGIYKVIKPP